MVPVCVPRPFLLLRILGRLVGTVETNFFRVRLEGCIGCLAGLTMTCELGLYSALCRILLGRGLRLCRSMITGTGNRITVASSE